LTEELVAKIVKTASVTARLYSLQLEELIQEEHYAIHSVIRPNPAR
jgi:hypothetical protein